MSLSSWAMEFDLVVFGDSYTDGGQRGYGVPGIKVDDGFPSSCLDEPLRRIVEEFRSAWPFAELGYYQGCFSDGLAWPHLVGARRVWNFAHGDGTTCQSVEGLVDPPPGYVAVPSGSKVGRHSLYARGLAQQIRQAAHIVPKDLWPDVVVVIPPLGNDLLQHGERGIGTTPKDAATSPFMNNVRQAYADIRALGVPDDHIINGAGPTVHFLRILQESYDPAWMFAQVAALNECLDDFGRRWRVDRILEKLNDHPSPAIPMYEVLKPKIWCKEDLVKQAAKEALLFDEYHPGKRMHEEMAESLREFISAEFPMNLQAAA